MTKEELEKEAILYVENIIPADVNYYLTKKYSKEQVQQAYLAGAELREKRIADLEKENAELKAVKVPQLERKIASIRGCHSVDAKKLKARTEQVERLKKENAELRKIAEFEKSVNGEFTAIEKLRELRLKNEQLTKAKDLLRKFLESKSIEETCIAESEAERFLKEAEA